MARLMTKDAEGVATEVALSRRLPHGGWLPEGAWQQRHRGITALLWAHAVAIPIFALARGYSLTHALIESSVAPLTAAAASTALLSRRMRMMATSLGLLSCSAVLVHLSGGLIEMHFHFFVIVVVISLYQDWLPFLSAIAYVLIQHGIFGAINPGSVFNHPSAMEYPWRWAGVHSLFIAAISVASIVNWRVNERHAQQATAAENRFHELYDEQRSAAETLQRSLLPDKVTGPPGFEIAARYRPAGAGLEVGGDWYDSFTLPSGSMALVMGDVVGHGIRAASIMGQLRNAVRSYAIDGSDAVDVVTKVNVLACELDMGCVATMVFLILDPATGEMEVVRAGHPPPLVADPEGGVAPLECDSGLPLGVSGQAEYTSQRIRLEPGAALVLYTDGLVETRAMPIDDGTSRLCQAARDAPTHPEEMCDYLLSEVSSEFTADDTALLVVRRLVLGPALDFSMPKKPGTLQLLRTLVGRSLSQAGASEDESYEILVAVSEACANVIRHSGDKVDKFRLVIKVGDSYEVRVSSTGEWRETPGRRGGGRGLPLMHALMDEVTVAKGPPETVVTMTRRLERVGSHGTSTPDP